MNQKDFFKKVTVKNGAVYAAEKVAPVYSRYNEKIKALAQKNPKRTITAMVVFATLNFLLMVYLVNSRPATALIPKDIGKTITESNQRKSQAAAFSIPNYIKISKLKDSLDYLIRLPALTKNDSLLFIRICEEYTKLDPTFFKQVEEAIHRKK
jgi:hypothetical protein